MKVSRPDIPKRLAAQIRKAQLKVEFDRQSVISTESEIANDQKWLGEFDADPESFARRHYRHHTVDSYPVTTNISRSRERLEYNQRRLPIRIERLLEAERALIAVEDEVLQEVAAMRFTSGHVPWPAPLKPMKKFREALAEEQRRWEEQDRRERAAYAIKEAADDKQRLVDVNRNTDREVAEYRRQFALFPSEEQARQNVLNNRLMEALKSGEISPKDFLMTVINSREERP